MKALKDVGKALSTGDNKALINAQSEITRSLSRSKEAREQNERYKQVKSAINFL